MVSGSVGVDGTYPFECARIDNDIGERVEIMHRIAIANLWALNAQRFGLTVDPFGGRALAIKALVGFSLPIQLDALLAARSNVDVFDTAHAFGKLLMVARLPTRAGHQ